MPDRTTLEDLKLESDFLAGALREELAADEDAFAKDTTQILKFHGIYQQDDRDVRKQRQRAGLGKDVSCMVRASIPGGVLTPAQYLAADDLADRVGAGNLRVTTRQGLQWHFVSKHDLSTLIRTLNEHLVTTLAACGDVARNTMACPDPTAAGADEVQRHAAALARAVRPRTQTYWDLWLAGERCATALAPEAVGDLDGPEPLYGPTYLPRKFKIGFVSPGDNCVDAYTNDVGIVPHLGGDGRVESFTLLVGGGLGMSHNNDATFPRLADPLGAVEPSRLIGAVAAIIAVQRDHGDRDNRKHARMKYLIHDRGLDWFRGEVEARLGEALDEPGALTWESTDDHLGWSEQGDGRFTLGVRVESGRIVDQGASRLRSALRTLVEAGAVDDVRFTPRQDVLLTGIETPAEVERHFADHGVRMVEDLLPIERRAMACPALPTCGLALTEAERVLPDLTEGIAKHLLDLELPQADVHVRMTGCPNGCARPYSTEVGVVGRGADTYSLFLGGDTVGARLNAPFADRVARDEVPAVLRPVLEAWRDGRDDDEGFGDWCDRVGVATLAERFAPDPAAGKARRRAEARREAAGRAQASSVTDAGTTPAAIGAPVVEGVDPDAPA